MCQPDVVLEIADRLLARLDAGATLAVATVVRVEGSMPRTVGTSMAWDGEHVIGSIAGGCVEGAVVELAQQVLEDGVVRSERFGVSDDTAFGFGLSCGGVVGVRVALLRPDDPVVPRLRDAAAGRPARVVIAPDGHRIELCADGVVDEVVPPARMIVLGAMEFSAALAAAARAVGYRVTIVDPRALFLTPERFPDAELVVRWPPEHLVATPIDERTVICVLSHDDRYDAEAILVALRSPAAFVGAMSSRRTLERRRAALRELGATDDELARLHAPIGLDLGAVTPAETAVSILAEILAARSGRAGESLRTTTGAIHSAG
ncbi:XdhC family protein [Pseudolysinimonas sp.]|uniref:XdhC family protein n=1 Tax=Pseudolysinimonas sp. TaxID=2680009 RepID=UPI003F81D1D0